MNSEQRSPQRRLPVGLLVLVVLLGLTAGVAGWRWWPDECGNASSGIRLNSDDDAECIGVTDGSYPFNDPGKATNDDERQIIQKINDLQQRIARENQRSAMESRYVKVVLLMPLTVSQARPSAISLQQILYSLEGAYTALERINNSRDFGDASAMRVQLLLANQGSRQEAGPEFLDSILEESEPDHPVVAVVGLGASVPNTNRAVDHLASRSIPMVSAIASADSLTGKPLLWSVSPSNNQFAERLKQYLDGQDTLKSGVIVYDRNPDLYTRSLRYAFQEKLQPYRKFADDQAFQGSTLEQPAAPVVFAPIVRNLCNAVYAPEHPLDMVFYAGRIADFDAFAEALETRICDQPLTVVIADTGFAPTPDLRNTLKVGKIAVLVAAASDSVGWAKAEPGTPPGYANFLAAYRDHGFADEDLVDGYAIANHDALAAAVSAIRLAAEGKPTQSLTPEDIATQFGQLSLANKVAAASGTLSFPAEGGRATGGAIPVEYFSY